MKKSDLEKEINQFLEVWDLQMLCQFIEATYPMFELYNVSENEDWVKDALSEKDDDNVRTVRLVRTVYLMSRIAEIYAGRLAVINCRFKGLWKRMEELDK